MRGVFSELDAEVSGWKLGKGDAAPWISVPFSSGVLKLQEKESKQESGNVLANGYSPKISFLGHSQLEERGWEASS